MYLSLALLLLPPVASAADTGRDAEFRSESSLVLVPVSVEDRRGELLNTLAASLFTIRENHISQRIVSFTHEDAPLSAAVVFDASGSLSSSISLEQVALKLFLTGESQPAEASLYTVSSKPSAAVSLTSELGTLLNPDLTSTALGSTALIDTIFEALNGLRSAHNQRKAILVLSDGIDNHSRHLPRELLTAIEESGVQIFALNFPALLPGLKVTQIAEVNRGNDLLNDLASRTGGLAVRTWTNVEVESTITAFKRKLQDEYVIGFIPLNAQRDGRWHELSVSVAIPNVRVCARKGYRAF